MKKTTVLVLDLCYSFNLFAAISNWGVVGPNIFRGSAPSGPADFDFLKAQGVRHVISLEYFRDDPVEECRAAGLDCAQFGILLPPIYGSDHWFDYNMLQSAFAHALSVLQKGDGALYFHCYWGSDRTGTLAAALTIRSSACSGPYDATALVQKVTNDLQAHNFHVSLYPYLYQTVLSWAQNPPAWICAPALGD